MDAIADQRRDEPGRSPLKRWPRLRQFLWDHGPKSLWLRLVPVNCRIEPERYAIFLRALAQRRGIPGAIVEVGSFAAIPPLKRSGR